QRRRQKQCGDRPETPVEKVQMWLVARLLQAEARSESARSEVRLKRARSNLSEAAARLLSLQVTSQHSRRFASDASRPKWVPPPVQLALLRVRSVHPQRHGSAAGDLFVGNA